MDVAAGSEEAFDLEKYKRDCEAEMQQYLDIIGRDTPEGQALIQQWKAATSPVLPPTKGEAEETQLIDLRLLVSSSLHRRTAPDPEEQTSVERSIEANGLRDPIEVRPCGGRFEIISGHRRAEAYQRLFGRREDGCRAREVPAHSGQGAVCRFGSGRRALGHRRGPHPRRVPTGRPRRGASPCYNIWTRS